MTAVARAAQELRCSVPRAERPGPGRGLVPRLADSSRSGPWCSPSAPTTSSGRRSRSAPTCWPRSRASRWRAAGPGTASSSTSTTGTRSDVPWSSSLLLTRRARAALDGARAAGRGPLGRRGPGRGRRPRALRRPRRERPRPLPPIPADRRDLAAQRCHLDRQRLVLPLPAGDDPLRAHRTRCLARRRSSDARVALSGFTMLVVTGALMLVEDAPLVGDGASSSWPSCCPPGPCRW